MEIVFDFDKSTIEAINEFNKLLAQIKKKYPNLTMSLVREYLTKESNIKDIPEECYSSLDALYSIRLTAIKNETKYILAQAKKSIIEIPKGIKDILEGKSLVPFLEDEYYETMPTLKIIEYMTFYSPEEIAQIRDKTIN